MTARDAVGHPSQQSKRALDWFVFFVADVQTGFGPFVAVYLTTQHWTQVDIGLAMTIGGLVSLAGQMPGGALVDAARSERLVAGAAVCVIGLNALTFALRPTFPVVLAALVLHSAASCVLGPAIAAISLGMIGHAEVGERFGRNARFAALGSGLSAAAMGTVGYFFSARSVFVVTFLLMVPALLVLYRLKPGEIDPERAHGAEPRVAARPADLRQLLGMRPLLVFGLCILLFHLANAAMLPLMGSLLTLRSGQWATVLVGACMVGPQLIVVALSPWVGRQAGRWGRKPLLLAGFAALTTRGLFFAGVSDPALLVVVQLLDGLTAAVLGVMVPLTIADLTRGTGRFNLTQGMVGMVMGVGATLSPTLAGYLNDGFGSAYAFATLATVGLLGFATVLLLMPETRPKPPSAAGSCGILPA